MLQCFHGIACYFKRRAVWYFVVGEGLCLTLNLMRWLPSHRAPVVLCVSSFLGLGVVFLPFAGVGLFGLLGVRLILGIIFHAGFVTREG